MEGVLRGLERIKLWLTRPCSTGRAPFIYILLDLFDRAGLFFSGSVSDRVDYIADPTEITRGYWSG